MLGGGESAFGQMSAIFPHPIAGIWNKAPFHQPGLFTGFWAASSWTPPTYLSVIDLATKVGLATAGYGWLRLATAGYGWLWLATADYGWLWLATAGYGWLVLAMAGHCWLWLATAGYVWLWLSPALLWHLAFLGLPGESYSYDNVWACCSWLASPRYGIWGTFLAVAKAIWFEDPPCFYPAQHWLPTYAFLGGMETCTWDGMTSSKTR